MIQVSMEIAYDEVQAPGPKNTTTWFSPTIFPIGFKVTTGIIIGNEYKEPSVSPNSSFLSYTTTAVETASFFNSSVGVASYALTYF